MSSLRRLSRSFNKTEESIERQNKRLVLHQSLMNKTYTPSLPLDSETRALVVPELGHDFSQIPVHSDAELCIQAKLKISQSGDVYEREADRVADVVMRMPELEVQRREKEEKEEILLAKQLPGQTTEIAPNLEERIQSLLGRGQPLSESVRAFFEDRFGSNFSDIRVHTDGRASEIAMAMNARAFTVGQDIIFGVGQYAPNNYEGSELLAHELVHTTQQKEVEPFLATHGLRAPTVMRAPLLGEPQSPIETLSLLGGNIPIPTIVRDEGNIFATVYFANGSFFLDEANLKVVESLSEELSLMTSPVATVDGHASTEGSTDYNMKLSKKRQFGVIAILRSKLIGSLDFKGEAYGETKPAVPETGKTTLELETKRARNRRVEIFILSSPIERVEKKLDLSLPIKPETIEERVERILREKPPEPYKRPTISELGWKKVDEVIDRVVPKRLRGHAKRAARSGSEKILEAALDAMGVSGDAKRAIKEAIRNAGQTIRP